MYLDFYFHEIDRLQIKRRLISDFTHRNQSTTTESLWGRGRQNVETGRDLGTVVVVIRRLVYLTSSNVPFKNILSGPLSFATKEVSGDYLETSSFDRRFVQPLISEWYTDLPFSFTQKHGYNVRYGISTR